MLAAILATTLIAVPQNAPAADRPPRALIQLRDAAVTAWRPALSGNWTSVADQLTTMRAAIAELPPGMQKPDLRQQLHGRMEALQSAVHDRRAADAAANANWIARIADEMAVPYEAAVPADVRLLAFFGRAAEADAAGHRRARVKVDIADMHTVWRRVEPMVLRRGAEAEARRFADAMVRLEGVSGGEVAAAADAEVDAADRIAQLFVTGRRS